MSRLCLALLLSIALPTVAAAQGLSRENCRATRDILAQVIEGRKAGMSAKAVTAQLSKGEQAVDEKYVETVPPLVKLASSLARKSATPAISSGAPTRLSADRSVKTREEASLLTMAAAKRVSTSPGAMALTRIPAWPHSAVRVLVSEMTLALLMA